MEDFNSKYSGEQVEALLDQVASGEAGGGGGGITIETDPVFSASPAASITEEKKIEWDEKQDAITDLDAIRSGAEKGATALQEEAYKGTIKAVDTSDAVDEPDVPQVTENAVSTNRIIACVARFDGTQWNLINDEGHIPLNVTGISGTSTDEFTITFPAYSKVNSLVATPDETLAAGGIKCGASVGLDYATIRLRQDRLVRLFVTTNANGDGGTVTRQEWDTRTDVSGFTVSIKQNTSLGNYIRLDDTKGNIDGSALPTIGGAFNAFLFGTKPGYINIQLRQPDGSVSDYKSDEFQIGWPMLNVKPIFTSQEMSKGNVWIYGIMEE